MTMRPGWFERQSERVAEEAAAWPAWMRRAAGLEKGTAMTPDRLNQIEAANESGTLRPDDVRELIAEMRRLLPKQPGKTDWSKVIGKWPGDETDEQIEEALRKLS